MEAPFTLDTSGCVRLLSKDAPWKGLPKPDIYWTDLSPFAQGYVEALFASLRDATHTTGWAFRYLAPETLSTILKDCEAIRAVATPALYPATFAGGLVFWWDREDGFSRRSWDHLRSEMRASAPVLAPYEDAGKVRLREVNP